MKIDDGGGQISAILLGPLFLLHDLLATLVPGGLFLLLLAFKGNATVVHAWLALPFGYKANVAVALSVSYIIGKLLQLPTAPFLLFEEKLGDPPANMAHLPADVRQMLVGAIAHGALNASREVAERMAVERADVAFHAGMALSLLAASLFPGDGRFRWTEALAGLAFGTVGIIRRQYFERQTATRLGAGMAVMLGHMSKEQLGLLVAIFKALKLAKDTGAPEVPIGEKVVGKRQDE